MDDFDDILEFLNTQEAQEVAPPLPNEMSQIDASPQTPITMLPHFNEAEEQYSKVKINRWLHSLDESSQSKYSNIIDDFAAFIPIKQQDMADNSS